jgi:ketopantoate reductase
MKEWIAKYQKAIVGTGAVSVLLICFLQQKEMSKLRAEVKQIEAVKDSLQSEDFVKGTIITRYEITLEMLKEENSKAADQFELIMSTKTE